MFKRCLKIAAVLAPILVLGACSNTRPLMPTPNEALGESVHTYEQLNPELRSTEVELLYITDRLPETDEDGNLVYGYGRSPSVAFGTTTVDLGTDISWDELLRESRTHDRSEPVELTLGEINEVGRGPKSPIPFNEVDGKIVEDPAFKAARDEAAQELRQLILQRLSLTPRKEVHVFIHGFNNTFHDAAFTLAELWHFLGRYGVPVIYTWPAGHPGIQGYTYDRESSEFTVYHLRQMLTYISSFPEIEKINIISHSRGTSVAVTALRELTIGARAAGINPRRQFKIHNFVLAAPDLDVQVAAQRIIGDFLAWSTHRFTIYSSPSDKAIGLADWLFDSPKGRIGDLQQEDLTERIRDTLAKGTANLSIINFTPDTDRSDSRVDVFGHSYFHDSPTASSDLILMLRDDLDAGDPGRPLVELGDKFWRIPAGYPDMEISE